MPVGFPWLAVSCALQQPALLEPRKAALMTTLAELRRAPTKTGRDAVLRAIADVEACGIVDDTPEGRWALIFSTQASAPDPQRETSLAQPLIDATYSLFFKVAPQLAGAQPDGGLAGGGSNEQRLSLTSGLVENRVRVPLPASRAADDGGKKPAARRRKVPKLPRSGTYFETVPFNEDDFKIKGDAAAGLKTR